MNWQKTRLGNIITTKKGFAFKSAKYVDSGVPIVRVSDFTSDSISEGDLKYYPKEEAQNYLDYELHYKDIIIQTVGSWPNNPASVVGKVVRVPYILDKSLLNQNAVKIVPKNNIDNDFLYYRLKSRDFDGHVIGQARGAANQASITLETIRSFKMSIPDYSEQIRLGKILTQYDDLIANNNKRIKILEQMAENLYKEWFVRFRFPGYETAEFVDGVPKDWSVVKLHNYVDIKAGGDRPNLCKNIPDDKCNIPIYSNGINNDGLYGYTTEAVIKKESITISARGTVGFVCLRRKPFVPIVRLLALTPTSDDLSAIYLYYLLRNDELIGNGTSQQQITIPMVQKKKVLKPKRDIVRQFTSYAKELWDEIDLLQQQNQNLTKQRDYLLPRLMSGKLQVK
ncbi:restriction endonuclease subunit S [Selenomonas ruminantium]|uniref:restriction endonuclease subunit S n=1 Tax=Selenomonas ruminantium TaxID=971 RepID=UPI0026F0CF64|nr:restriction endonuclease subunit S [Selenomonas ruminantium]